VRRVYEPGGGGGSRHWAGNRPHARSQGLLEAGADELAPYCTADAARADLAAGGVRVGRGLGGLAQNAAQPEPGLANRAAYHDDKDTNG